MIIYKATNNVNKKCYIGQTKFNIEIRKKQHSSNGFLLHNAIRKYGIDAFEWEVIDDTCQSKEELDEMEYHYIKQYHSHISEYGYNMTWGGDGIHGYKHTEKSKKKMSESLKGRLSGKNNPMYGKIGKLHPNFGKKLSKETKKKLSESLKGKKHTKKTRKKMSESHKGKNNINYGKTGDKHHSSKTYEITFPNGKKRIITGIKEFCRKNNLTPQSMCAVAKGKNKHHKGFKCKLV